MKIVLTYSSKEGLRREFRRRYPEKAETAPEDCFAEGDTPATIGAVRDAIKLFGHDVIPAEAEAGLEAQLSELRPDLVFNLAEGLFGDSRESYVPMLCEKLSLPCTGSSALTTAICLHKGRCKEILTANRIPNPDFLIFRPGDSIDLTGCRFPAIVKPVSEGSSKGIFDRSVADTADQAAQLIRESLRQYIQPVILEEFLAGAEYTAAVIGNGKELEILPLVELDFARLPAGSRPIYSYEAKWVWDTPEAPLPIFRCPTEVSPKLEESMERLIRSAFRVLELRDWCRLDIRLDQTGNPQLIEVNPIPGILPDPADNSCFPKAARAAGYDYAQIFGKVIEAAASRYSLTAAATEGLE